MTLAELNTALQALNIPVAYNVFREPQTPPYICFLVIDYEQTYADDKNFVQNPVVRVEYYSKNKDISAETDIEALLEENEITWDKADGYLDTERLYMTTWEFEL